jgi:hypothetical protein
MSYYATRTAEVLWALLVYCAVFGAIALAGKLVLAWL